MEDPKAAVYLSCAYYQIHALVKDLKPNFLELLKDPEFKHSRAGQEIRQKMDQLTELYKQAMEEIDLPAKNKIPSNTVTPKQGQDGHPVATATTRAPRKPHSEDFRGAYVVGGSSFGWNFTTFPGNQAVYYGMTNEAFRTTQAIFSEY